MEKTRKNRIKQIVSWCCLGALVLGLAVMPLVAEERAESDGPVATVKSAQASMGDISRSLRFGGTLAAQEAVALTLPSGVKLTKFLVKNGDSVKQGDALAAVDPVSVMEAIAAIQDTLDYLDDQLNAVDTSSGKTYLTAQTTGTVKRIYGEKGNSVQDVMLANGALAVLSLDGKMAVDVETETVLQVGDSLLVTVEGEEITGRVESRLGNTFIVTVEDKGYAVDQQVTVATKDGEELGSGPLYIHNPWRVTGVSGTISAIRVRENDKVTKGSTLMTLSDTDTASQQQILLGQRQDYEQTMEELFKIYRSGVLEAPCDGLVDGVEENSPLLLAAKTEQWTITLLSATGEESGDFPEDPSEEPSDPPEPSGDPSEPSEEPSEPEEKPGQPGTYTGLVALITTGEDGNLVYLTNGQSVTISAPEEVKQEQKEVSTMTTPVTYTGTPYLYVLSQGQLLLTATPAAAGQLVLITEEGQLISLGTVPSDEEAGGQLPEGSLPTMNGMAGYGGLGGGQSLAPSFQPYDLTETTVLTVTPTGTMTLEVPVDEGDIRTIALGQEMEVTITALGAEPVTATVTEIGTATNSGGNSKFAVTLTLTRQENMLPGMSASASLVVENRQELLTIPAAALQEEDDRIFVYTAYDEKNDTLCGSVTVTTGLSDGETVEILTGLEVGQNVYYRYYDAQET